MDDIEPVPASDCNTTSRRNFYVVAIYGLWGAISAALALSVPYGNERELIRLMRILTHEHDPAWLVMPGDILKGIIPTRPNADLRFEMHLAGVHDERAEPMHAVAGGC